MRRIGAVLGPIPMPTTVSMLITIPIWNPTPTIPIWMPIPKWIPATASPLLEHFPLWDPMMGRLCISPLL